MNTKIFNETSMHTKATNSSHIWRRTTLMPDHSASRKCAIARNCDSRIMEELISHAFVPHAPKTTTYFAHMASQIFSGRAQQNENLTLLSSQSLVSRKTNIFSRFVEGSMRWSISPTVERSSALKVLISGNETHSRKRVMGRCGKFS